MDALSLLKEDHDEVRRLFEELEQTRRDAFKTRLRLFETLREELEVHARIEEEIFYPALKASRSLQLRSLALEAVEEHRIVEDLLEDLDDVTPNDDEFDTKIANLRAQVLQHADEEEREIFVVAETELGTDRLKELGRELAERRKALAAQPANR